MQKKKYKKSIKKINQNRIIEKDFMKLQKCKIYLAENESIEDDCAVYIISFITC